MTEYDYSTEGYERYIATQNRVSNWVSDQVSRTPQHQAPFVARSVSQPPLQTRHSSSSTRDRHHSPSSSRSSSRPPPRRMHTTDVYHQSSRSGHAIPPQYPPQYYQTTSPLSYAPPVPLPQGHNAMYKTYEYDHNTREIVLPPPRRGETYVIIPPNGRRVEVVVSTFPTLALTTRLTCVSLLCRATLTRVLRGAARVVPRRAALC